MMKLTNKRVIHNDDSTLGVLYLDGIPIGFVIEDEPRDVKVANETRIDAGIYPVRFNMSLTPLTQKYRKRFKWFTWHLELQGVKKFYAIYIHIGNEEDETGGCQLVNRKAKIKDGNFAGEDSTSLFHELYMKISNTLSAGKEVLYEIIDMDE